MGRKQIGKVVFMFMLRIISSLSGSMAGSALLANEFYRYTKEPEQEL